LAHFLLKCILGSPSSASLYAIQPADAWSIEDNVNNGLVRSARAVYVNVGLNVVNLFAVNRKSVGRRNYCRKMLVLGLFRKQWTKSRT